MEKETPSKVGKAAERSGPAGQDEEKEGRLEEVEEEEEEEPQQHLSPPPWQLKGWEEGPR